MVIYANNVSNIEHIVLVKGDISSGDPVLVRMHALDLMADLLGEVSDKRAGDELTKAMAAIADLGRGVVVVLRESIAASLSSTVSQKLNLQVTRRKSHLRDYGVAHKSQPTWARKMILLSDTRPNVVSLEGYDLEITDWQPFIRSKFNGWGNFLIVEARFLKKLLMSHCRSNCAQKPGSRFERGPYRVRLKFPELLPWLKKVTVTSKVKLLWAVIR